MKCIDPPTGKLLERYLLKRLEPANADRFEDHLFECSKCRHDLLAEEMLSRFTQRHRTMLVRAPLETSVWSALKDLCESLMTAQTCPAIPLIFRNGTASMTGSCCPDISVANLTGRPSVCSGNTRTLIDSDYLIVSGFDPGITLCDVYLLICEKTDLLSLYPDRKQDMQQITDRLAGSVMHKPQPDSALCGIIKRSFIISGSIRRETLENSAMSRIAFHLSPVAMSYLKNPDYQAIVMIR